MRRQDGFVSLFTAILISLLLLVITVSLVSIEALQLRKAEDSEQTLRAYYAAEAGVEDAVSKVLAKTITPTSGANTCNASSGFDTSGNSEWTCQQVTFAGAPFGKLDEADQAKTVDPGHIASTPFTSVIIEWNQSTNTSAAYYNDPTLLTGNFKSAAAMNTAPPLELSILEYPTGGFAASQVCTNGSLPAGCVTKLQNLVLVPNGGASGIVSYASITGGGPRGGNCGNLGRTYTIGGTARTGYNCYAILNGVNSATKDYLFRIRSRYQASAYRLTFMSGNNGSGTQVDVPDGVATIDVTAKAGQTYRRVISKLPLNGSAASGLNFVIYSDTDVCKNFDVINNVPTGPPNC